MNTYETEYELKQAIQLVRYQACGNRTKRMMDEEGCKAFAIPFRSLRYETTARSCHQHLMAQGYGYGGEEDWKVSAMTAVIKAMSQGLTGGTSFMEDYLSSRRAMNTALSPYAGGMPVHSSIKPSGTPSWNRRSGSCQTGLWAGRKSGGCQSVIWAATAFNLSGYRVH